MYYDKQMIKRMRSRNVSDIDTLVNNHELTSKLLKHGAGVKSNRPKDRMEEIAFSIYGEDNIIQPKNKKEFSDCKNFFPKVVSFFIGVSTVLKVLAFILAMCLYYYIFGFSIIGLLLLPFIIGKLLKDVYYRIYAK